MNASGPLVQMETPCAQLRPYIRRFITVEFPVEHHDWHLPDTGMTAAFRLRGTCVLQQHIQAPRTAVTGLGDTLRTHAHGAGNANIIAAFTPMGAAAFLGAQVDGLFNTTVAMEDVLGDASALGAVHGQLQEAGDATQRVRVLERFFLGRLREDVRDPLVAAAVAQLEKVDVPVRVGVLAQRLGVSQSTLERRFRRLVGTSPRRFASIARLQHVARLRHTEPTLTTLALAAGYHDQSHFIRDFRRFTGSAPGQFFRRAPPV